MVTSPTAQAVGQIQSVDEEKCAVVVRLDESPESIKVPLHCVENLPRRFAGTLCKYSTKGIFKNWRIRYFEIWSNSLTYREENSPRYKGHLQITPTSEVVPDPGKPRPPYPYAFGILNNGKIFRICSDNEYLIEEMKRSVQDCINDAVMYESS